MVDEPNGDARLNDTGAAVRSAAQYEVEWKDGLSRLMSNLETELERALDTARRQASDAVKGIERQGLDLLSTLEERRRESEAEQAAVEERVAAMKASIVAAEAELKQKRATAEREAEELLADARRRADGIVAEAQERAAQITAEIAERRREAEAEQAAIQERVAAMQAGIEAAEQELRLSQEEAEREVVETLAAARRRADSIIARAESRADEILDEARADAAALRIGRPSDRAAAGGEGLAAGERLRGLSERVGMLLATSGAEAGAAVIAAGATSPAETSSEAVTEEATERGGPSEAHIVQEAEEEPAHEAPEASVSREPSPPPELMRSWSRDSDPGDADDSAVETSEADTVVVPGAPAWPTAAESSAEDDAEPAEASAAHGDEPEFVRRTPHEAAATDEQTADEAPPPAAPSAAPESTAAADSATGPAGAVTQTLIFQSVPNFQAALALERSLKAMAEVREVRVADFDERQLTFQVTHELGATLPRVLLTQRAGELEFIDAKPERVEFIFRS